MVDRVEVAVVVRVEDEVAGSRVGRRDRVETVHCATDQCGRLTPPACQARMVSPEQSQVLGPVAPHWYGSPSWALANAMAAAAPADVALTVASAATATATARHPPGRCVGLARCAAARSPRPRRRLGQPDGAGMRELDGLRSGGGQRLVQRGDLGVERRDLAGLVGDPGLDGELGGLSRIGSLGHAAERVPGLLVEDVGDDLRGPHPVHDPALPVGQTPSNDTLLSAYSGELDPTSAPSPRLAPPSR